MRIKPSSKTGSVVMEMERDEERLLAPDTLRAFDIKTILVPSDFSECSRKALAYALPLARQFNARIVLLHVADFQYAGSEIDNLELPLIEKQVANTYRKRLADLAEVEAEPRRVEPAVRIGKVVPEIISAAKEIGADMIGIATHGCPAAERTFLGSTTERVVRHALCPVLVVREKEHEFLRQEEKR